MTYCVLFDIYRCLASGQASMYATTHYPLPHTHMLTGTFNVQRLFVNICSSVWQATYSYLQLTDVELTDLEQCGVDKLCTRFDTAAQDVT